MSGSTLEPTTALILSRSTEHIMVQAIGVFSVWLGYRLFRDMPLRREGETKISLPGGISILLSRVGPGIFFALFGTALIGYIVARPWTYQEWATAASSGSGRALSGFMPGSAPDATAAQPVSEGLPRERLVHVLADIAAELGATPMDAKRLQREIALRDSRARLMFDGWNVNWGNPESFRRWVFDRVEADPPPTDAAGAVAIYRGHSP